VETVEVLQLLEQRLLALGAEQVRTALVARVGVQMEEATQLATTELLIQAEAEAEFFPALVLLMVVQAALVL
jgi:hypothetical protein